jgi:hypothetical protein
MTAFVKYISSKQLMGVSEEDEIQINVLCDMALETMHARIRAFTKPEIAAICELDGCCMLRDEPKPQRGKQ